MSNLHTKHKKESDRHAFLILAHKNDLCFHTLISMLDYPSNDIFIHMDAKTKNYNEKDIKKLTKYSNIYHCSRTKVSWGGYSQINAEILLLKKATKHNHYKYYHLLSGQDLPIKTQTEIHDFFKKNQGKEFIRFQNPIFTYNERVNYYHFLQEIIGRKTNILLIRMFHKISIIIQKTFHIRRNSEEQFQKGTNWFSVTDNLARYIVDNESWIQKTFKHTSCCDEIFLQTLVHNSNFKNNLYHKKYDNDLSAIMRLIDWDRGNPYVFKNSNFDEIKKSKHLFARKFDEQIDKNIIQKIQKTYSNN